MESEFSACPTRISMREVSVVMSSMEREFIAIITGMCLRGCGKRERKMGEENYKLRMGFYKLDSGLVVSLKSEWCIDCIVIS